MIIQIDDLSYTYPNQTVPALRGLSWQVAEGEFVLLTGPSGSGKSTLLRCLNGLVPHFSGGQVAGRVRVAGVDAVAVGPRLLSQRVGFVMQSPEAQAVLDRVEAEIVFGMEQAAVAPVEMERRLAEVLGLLGLERLRQREIRTLSGGERQRVAIAAALVLRPQLLLLDEPTSQLDPQAAAELLALLGRLRQELGLTVVVAEHRLGRLLPEVDRVTYMAAGEIVADGAVQAVLPLLPSVPPLVALGLRRGWSPLPLTVAAARVRVGDMGEKTAVLPPISADHKLPAAENVLVVAEMTICYGQTTAVQAVDLTVARGEVVALLGRNGAGKSSLLRGIVGLQPLAAGEVWLNGRLTQGRSVAEICREVAYLPQNPDDLLFAETVRTELLVTLRNHGLALDEGVVVELLGRLGLTAVAGAYPRDLSVGQRQRVALGAVTVTRPGLLLLDEPTRGLDRAAKEALVAIWQGWRQAGMGILLVTHDVELVAGLADRVVVMENGRVVDVGEKTAVLSRNPLFTPQIGQIFPGSGWLTVEDVV